MIPNGTGLGNGTPNGSASPPVTQLIGIHKRAYHYQLMSCIFYVSTWDPTQWDYIESIETGGEGRAPREVADLVRRGGIHEGGAKVAPFAPSVIHGPRQLHLIAMLITDSQADSRFYNIITVGGAASSQQPPASTQQSFGATPVSRRCHSRHSAEVFVAPRYGTARRFPQY